MTASEIRSVLTRLDLQPSRKLGQNFLTDPEVAHWIADQLNPQPEDHVLEIGAGTGALSEHLATRVRHLTLIEKDHRLAAFLKDRFADHPTVTVHDADALEFDPRPLFAEQPCKIIGNLPYSCGGEILRRFLKPPHPFSRAVFMLQKEVAERLTAVPRTKDYGVLTLRVQAHWNVEFLRTIGPKAFHPEPQIDSAIIALEPRTPGEFPPFDHLLFDRLIRQGFAQRRKQLHKLLKVDWQQVVEELNFLPTTRGEELDVLQWIQLTRLLDTHPLKELPQSGDEPFDVVDANDQVIRQETRRVVHANDLLHRAVHGFVFNRRGELFLQRRSQLKDTHPGVWDSSASGHLNVGEDYHTGMVREFEEELGLDLTEVKEIARITPSERTGWEHIRLYEAHTNTQPTWCCSEIEYGAFFPLPLIREWAHRRPQDFATGFLACLEAYNARELHHAAKTIESQPSLHGDG